MVSTKKEVKKIRSALGDLRLTKQRKEVYGVLKESHDHPTAMEVFMRTQKRMPSISLATVYNCLETLTHCHLVKQVNVDREPSRYCPNLKEHGHFCCVQCGEVTDISFATKKEYQAMLDLPGGFEVNHVDITMKGVCKTCAKVK